MSRKHCKKDWHTHIQPIREKINAAIQDMPENKEIVQLLSGTCKFKQVFIIFIIYLVFISHLIVLL
jgi:hypothetical protein